MESGSTRAGQKSNLHPGALLSLVLAGEAIFFLPFILARIFRPTLLDVFQIDKTELGTYISVYGVVAILAYFFGGPLADRFRPHRLMSAALLLTAAGGLYMSTFPSGLGMYFLYGFWGFSTIFLFWSALMKTTRILGGASRQGLAFGLLDGGRGLFAALSGSILVLLLSGFLPTDPDTVSLEEQRKAFRWVILSMSSIVAVVGVVVLFGLRKLPVAQGVYHKMDWANVRNVLKLRDVWIQAFIIICAYSGYKVTDDFSLLADEVLGFDKVEAAGLGTMSLYLRPIAAVSAGILADKFKASLLSFWCFFLMLFAGLLLGFGIYEANVFLIAMIAIASTSIAVFAMRGLYFAIMGEMKIPLALTGTAVGIASVIGYLPDVYMGPLMGYFLDNWPGAKGHGMVFLALAAFAFLGAMSVYFFMRTSSTERSS